MLIEFSVENYLSFKERITLSMVASRDGSLPDNVFKSAQGTDFDLLKCAALYGPNASGKSNLISALAYMSAFVSHPLKEGHPDFIKNKPYFKPDSNCKNQPTTFEVIFLHDGIRYQYGFSFNSNVILEEWLYSYPKKQQRVIFERFRSENNTEYKFGSHWKGEKKKIVELTRVDTLFLAVASLLNNNIALTIMEWFDKFIMVNTFPFGEDEGNFTVDQLIEDPSFKNVLLELLQIADFEIIDFNIVERSVFENIDLSQLTVSEIQELKQSPKDARIIDLKTIHRLNDNKGEVQEVIFTLDEESDGTKKIFAMAGLIVHGLKNGYCLFMDELDVQLHPLLTLFIIRLFSSTELNKKGTQFIFTTHDVNILDKEIFRRDQIWFTEKQHDGSSKLFSLWDFKKTPRKKENIRNGYLKGRYGAIPLIENYLQDWRLKWTDEEINSELTDQ